MTNSNINISTSNITGKCDAKCSYSFKYTDSNSTAKNHGTFIRLSYDSASVPPVVYNGDKYTVNYIQITSPSIHRFNNNALPGEIVISHSPVKGGKSLEVCVPLVASADTSRASQVVTQIIKKVANNAPRNGDATSLHMDLNLSAIVPRTPFFMYTTNESNWIVYSAMEAIPISSATIKTLRQIIKPYAIKTGNAKLFYNSKGPDTRVQLGDGVYISCQPTGASSEKTTIVRDKPTTSLAFDFQHPIVQYVLMSIMVCIVLILMFYGIQWFFTYLSSKAPTAFAVMR
ncbi:MAG: hypothetical protein ACOVRN_07385 [Flavobacterium sp.]